jgi:hypothetical protein
MRLSGASVIRIVRAFVNSGCPCAPRPMVRPPCSAKLSLQGSNAKDRGSPSPPDLSPSHQFARRPICAQQGLRASGQNQCQPQRIGRSWSWSVCLCPAWALFGAPPEPAAGATHGSFHCGSGYVTTPAVICYIVRPSRRWMLSRSQYGPRGYPRRHNPAFRYVIAGCVISSSKNCAQTSLVSSSNITIEVALARCAANQSFPFSSLHR